MPTINFNLNSIATTHKHRLKPHPTNKNEKVRWWEHHAIYRDFVEKGLLLVTTQISTYGALNIALAQWKKDPEHSIIVVRTESTHELDWNEKGKPVINALPSNTTLKEIRKQIIFKILKQGTTQPAPDFLTINDLFE